MANETKLSPAEQCIKDYLDNYAAQDAVFAIKYMTSGKTLKGAMSYITNEARKQKNGNCACITDQEVFGWAVHYFDEDSLNCEKDAPVATVKTATEQKCDTYPKPATPKKAAAPKAAKPKTAAPAAPQPAATVTKASTEGDDEVIDLFAGLFD